jgi:hypothetical protein
VQLAILAPSTSQSRPAPGRASSQPLLDEHEASDCSVLFGILVDGLWGRLFSLLTRNSSSRKSSRFVQNHQPRLDDRIQNSTPWSPVQFSYPCTVASYTQCRFQLRPYHGIIFGNSTWSSAGSEKVRAMRLERLWGQASRISWILLLAC